MPESFPAISMAQEVIVSTVRGLIGCSLEHDSAKLCEFIGRGIDDGHSLLSPKVSDCGLFGLAVWHAAGVDHELVGASYINGMAISWLVHIAHDMQAIRYPKRDGLPRIGSLMHYYSKRPSTNDHVEFCLSLPATGSGLADHAGGGRANCAIGSGHSTVLWSSGRPLQCWYDADALLCGVE